MNRCIILICFAALFCSCKKDHKVLPAPTLYDVIGTWTLYSFTSSGPGAPVTADYTHYPCMGENVLKINPDNTSIGTYMGSDTCYVTAQRGYNNAIFIGQPGQAPQSNSWTRNGNNITLGVQHATLTSVNGKLFLTTYDTLKYYTPVVFITLTDIKQ